MRSLFFLKSYFYRKIITILFVLITSYQCLAADDELPSFVVNVIARVPSSFQKLADIDQYKAAVKDLPYYIEKDTNAKNPSRGMIVAVNFTPDANARKTSAIVGSFFNTLERQSFGESDEVSKDIVRNRLKVAVLLNRMQSVDKTANQEFYNIANDLPQTIEHIIFATLWQPQWMKKETITSLTGQTRSRLSKVSLSEVAEYYTRLKQDNSILAQAFLQINEHQELNSIVPYRELRELLLKDKSTKNLVGSARAYSPKAPVYIAFMDSDVASLRTSTTGIFSVYEQAIVAAPNAIHGLTTGYCVFVSQNPFIAFAVALDLATRQALSTVFPLAPYFPEPNAVIRVLDGYETLEVSFPGVNFSKYAHYTSPQELPLLIHEVVKCRFQGSNLQASSYFKFIADGALETEVPQRFLQNRKKKDGTKNAKMFCGEFSQKDNQFMSITIQDLTMVRNTSQSHLKSRDWAGYVYKDLEERMKTGSITIIEINQPGAIVKNRKDQFLISMFASVHGAHSPTAITLREVKAHDYNLLEYLFDLLQNYEERVPAKLTITYGKADKSTKLTGNLMRKHIATYDGAYGVIDRFYSKPVAALVAQAAHSCGRAEIPVIVRYIQFTYKQAPLKALVDVGVKQEDSSRGVFYRTSSFSKGGIMPH